MTTHKDDDLENEDWDNGYAESMAWRESQLLQQQPWMTLQKPNPPPRAPMKTFKAVVYTGILFGALLLLAALPWVGAALLLITGVALIHRWRTPEARSRFKAGSVTIALLVVALAITYAYVTATAQTAQPPAAKSDVARCMELRGLSAEACLPLVRHGPLPEADPSGNPGVAKMTFQVFEPGTGTCCRWIQADGMIEKSTPEDFRRFLETADIPFATVRLNSSGGSLTASLALGRIFRARDISTEVGSTQTYWTLREGREQPVGHKIPGVCNSGCAYAFLGGVDRTARQGELGFHQYAIDAKAAPAMSLDERTSEAQRTAGWLIEYVEEMEIDPAVLALAFATSSEKVTTPDAATMRRTRITTDGCQSFAHQIFDCTNGVRRAGG